MGSGGDWIRPLLVAVRRRSGCGRQREEVAVEEVVAAVEWIWDVGRGEKERVGAPAVE